jgi:hypothetical protein
MFFLASEPRGLKHRHKPGPLLFKELKAQTSIVLAERDSQSVHSTNGILDGLGNPERLGKAHPRKSALEVKISFEDLPGDNNASGSPCFEKGLVDIVE